jgi:hypothetical protein
MNRIVQYLLLGFGPGLAAARSRAAEPDLYYNVETGAAKSTGTSYILRLIKRQQALTLSSCGGPLLDRSGDDVEERPQRKQHLEEALQKMVIKRKCLKGLPGHWGDNSQYPQPVPGSAAQMIAQLGYRPIQAPKQANNSEPHDGGSGD